MNLTGGGTVAAPERYVLSRRRPELTVQEQRCLITHGWRLLREWQCKSETRARTSGGMPLPVSVIATASIFACCCASILTEPPGGVYCKALSQRFETTRVSISGSAAT